MSTKAHGTRERHLEAARGYLMLDLPGRALEELAAVDDPQKCPFEYQQLRGEVLRQREEYELARDSFQAALDHVPDDLISLMGLAWCYKRIDQLPNAIEAMEQAYRSSPKEPIVLYNLACYFALAGDKERALSWLGRALRMQPSLRKLIPDETDFDSLRDDADFQLVTEKRRPQRK